jgi:hypothetical protein
MFMNDEEPSKPGTLVIIADSTHKLPNSGTAAYINRAQSPRRRRGGERGAW